MKKTVFLLSISCLGLLSCSMDEPFRHTINIAYPSALSVVYADQTSDSILFDTFDSYEVTSQTDWVKVLDTKDYPSHASINNSYYNMWRVRVNLQIEPNTTQKVRNGYVAARSYGKKWDETGHGYYKQLGWHNVLHPSPVYTYDKNNVVEACYFLSKDSAMQLIDTLRFEAYEKWTLEQDDGGFVHAAQTFGEVGINTLILSLQPNNTKTERNCSMKLMSSSGVVTTIKFVQAGKKEE